MRICYTANQRNYSTLLLTCLQHYTTDAIQSTGASTCHLLRLLQYEGKASGYLGSGDLEFLRQWVKKVTLVTSGNV